MYNPWHPPPAPPGFGEGKVLPKGDASLISKLLFSWLDSLLGVGFTHLWQLPTPLLTKSVSNELEHNFYSRCPPEKRSHAFHDVNDEQSNSGTRAPTPDEGTAIHPRSSTLDEKKGDVDGDDKLSSEPDIEKVPQKPTSATNSKSRRNKKKGNEPKQDSSLLMAIHTTFFWQWWISGLLKLASANDAVGVDTLKTTTPLLNKRLLTWLTNSYVFYKGGPAAASALGIDKPQGIGYGIGIAFGLFAMQEVASLMTNHYMQMSMTMGVTLRTGIIGAIFRKSLRLSGRARMSHSVGQITTMISTDATRLDRSTMFMHNLWVAPIQIAIGIGLLIGNIGYSALVGLGVLVLGFPVQLILVKIMFGQRKKMVKITDQRVRLTTEVLQGIRLIKYYAWESFYTGQIAKVRERELLTVRKVAFARGAMIGIVTILPVVAAVLSFITYALSGHDLNVAIIFSSLQFFNIIRAPLAFFPLVVANCADAAVALGRIGNFLTAEELAEPYAIDKDCKHAIEVDGDFQWETVPKSIVGGKFEQGKKGKDGAKDKKTKKSKSNNEEVLPTATPKDGDESKEGEMEADDKPFELKDLNLKIPKGAFVAIVGRVGSGKSSLLQALIGEMRKTRGNCVFSSSAAYVPQSAWIMNATLRDNIIFGSEEDEDKLQEIIKACCLERDLEMLPNGEFTEIGEKGINLSGGQKARVSLARAAYSGADIVLMDDSLSAVDAYVGKAILENCLLSGPLADKTRVLVTHSLHILDKTDYIFVMDNGVIVEQGAFQDLMNDSVLFSRVMEEYGTHEKEEEDSQKDEDDSKAEGVKKDKSAKKEGLMQAEERLTGSVTGSVYKQYFQYSGGLFKLPVILLLLAGYQCASVANNLVLGFWTSESIHGFNQGDYMGTYAALGVAIGLFSFLSSFYISITSLDAGFNMFKASLSAVLYSAVSFFDTTPVGRILSRLSKDQDTIDTEISMTAFQLLSTFSSVLGTAGLVFYTYPLLGIIFAPLTVFYYITAVFYRRTSVEVKRLDSLMRSTLYGSYSETLTGLSTVRAYREQTRFVETADHGLDLENRAYYITIAIQRWLSVRLDFLGNLLILGIALFSAGFRKSVNPSKTGVVLSYTLSITQVFSDLVSTYAQNEQNFNAVERVLHYTELPPEGDLTTSNDPSPSWPEKGEISFENVEMAYRKGLPLVLKDISFNIKAGEKVGVVGRTGAGKSSLLQALFRFVELQGGSISIDGHNIAEIGLETLRSRLALVPQDSTLFLGTLRENLDPQATKTDAELIESLKRAWLLPREGVVDPPTEAKFSLDASVNDEGSNYSAGEKQLLALCRALIKNSRIIVLDEATSNVDVETDAKLQRTIQTEFATSTLLCIAHRLNTIVYYDRILVMDVGRVAEFDTPLHLFDDEQSIFRSLCDEAGLTREHIVRIRSNVHSLGLREDEL
ncbi:multidrug resistance-associated ABC transporter [Irpex rosettiformis]|uniref:Multidrug resistance-associated ABC transporter n=1 Tax=Irpex rosettiformis TaxID=378272 RepID=A0ACB8TYU0_9APHY|nr:multidrug resistance-associated ABC transporter [Irpex rosettiformis]